MHLETEVNILSINVFNAKLELKAG